VIVLLRLPYLRVARLSGSESGCLISKVKSVAVCVFLMVPRAPFASSSHRTALALRPLRRRLHLNRVSDDAIEQTASRAGLSGQVSHEMIGSEVAQRLMPQINFRNPQQAVTFEAIGNADSIGFVADRLFKGGQVLLMIHHLHVRDGCRDDRRHRRALSWRADRFHSRIRAVDCRISSSCLSLSKRALSHEPWCVEVSHNLTFSTVIDRFGLVRLL